MDSMNVNMMLERRVDQLITKLNTVFTDLTINSGKIHEGPSMIAESMHDAVKGELTACALLSRQNPTFLIDKLMVWSRQTADSLSTGKKFITSFGSLRIEKEARLTFAEMKRTATQILTSNCLETCLDCLERGKDNDDLVFTILSFSLELVNEIAPSTLRRDACIEPLRQIFRAIGRASMPALVGFMQAKIELISKSVGYELFIRSLFLVELSIYPSEDLDTSLNLVEILASYYSDSAGFGIREAYAQSLSRMLRPLVQHVSAEVNMPKWDKIFCKILLSRVTVLCEKQKYRQITLDLAVTVLCLCTKELFLEKWFGLCEAIAIMIKDGSLPESFTASILRLLWVYCNRFSEAFATRMSTISKIHSIFSPPQSRRLAVSSQLYQKICCGFAIILFPIQQSSLLRDIIQPLFDGSESCSYDSFPSSRVMVGIKTLLFLGWIPKVQEAIPDWETLKALSEISVEDLCEGFVAFRPDVATQDILLRVRGSISRVFQVLDMLIWEESVYDPKYLNSRFPGNGSQEADALCCLKLIIKVSPYLGLTMPNLIYFEILLKYCTHVDEDLSQIAIISLERHLLESDPDTLEAEKIYWIFSSRFDRVPDRCRKGLLILSELFVLIVELSLGTLGSEAINADDLKPWLAEISVKQLILLLSAGQDVRRNARVVGQIIDDWIQDDAIDSELFLEMQKMTLILGQASQDFPSLARALGVMIDQCPAIVGLSRSCLMARMQELQTSITGKAQYVDDVLVEQWSKYLAALLAFGPPDAESSTLNRRVDGISLRRLLSFSRSPSTLSSTKGLLKSALTNLFNDNDLVCQRLCDCASALAPRMVDDFFQVLEPHISAVSEDYRNVRYQVLRKNRRQELLKINVTKLLSRVAPKIRQNVRGDTPDYLPHRYLRRYIIEVFYFVTEIDTEGNIPGLKQALAELVQRYHQSIVDLHPRYEFFPFKLQHELFSKFCKWFEELRVGMYPGEMTGFMSGSIDSVGHIESGNSMQSTSLLALDIDGRDSERTFAEAMVSLCHGLVSPLPLYRGESVPTSKVLQWINVLSTCDNWGPSLVELAVNNLLITNQSLAEKILRKIFSPEIISTSPKLSDYFFSAISNALLDKKLEFPQPTVITLLCFKYIQGGEQSKTKAFETAVKLLDLQDQSFDINRLTRKYSQKANDIASEFLERAEGLLFDPVIGPRLKKHLGHWISMAKLPDGYISSKLLQNLAVVSIKSYQMGKIEDFLCLWEALSLCKAQVCFVVEFWLTLALKYSHSDLLNASAIIISHLYEEDRLRPLIKLTLTSYIEPVKCLLRKDHDHDYDQASATEAGSPSSRPDSFTRLDPLFQSADRKNSFSNLSIGVIVCEWVSDLSHKGRDDIFDCPEVAHLMMMLEHPAGLKAQDDKSKILDECLVSLEWALYCPIKRYSLLSWGKLKTQLGELSNFGQLLPLIVEYMSAIRRHDPPIETDGERITLEDLLATAFECINMAPASYLSSPEIVSNIKNILVDTQSPQVFMHCISAIKKVVVVVDDMLETIPLTRGYTNRMTWASISELLSSAMSMLFHDPSNSSHNPATTDKVGQILICLSPCIIVGVIADAPDPLSLEVIEAASMACNILDSHPGTMTITRILQTIGKRKRGDPLREIAILFAEPLFRPFSSLLVTTLIAALEGVTSPSEVNGLVSFITSWIQLVTGRFTGGDPEAWDLLIEGVLAKAHLGQVAEAIDALMAIRSSGSPEGFMGRVRSLLGARIDSPTAAFGGNGRRAALQMS